MDVSPLLDGLNAAPRDEHWLRSDRRNPEEAESIAILLAQALTVA